MARNCTRESNSNVTYRWKKETDCDWANNFINRTRPVCATYKMGDTCRICSATATLKCSLCKTASYCGKEHQKEDWKTHREVCLPFEVKTTPELGRYLEATRNLSTGDAIMTESPLVLGPRDEEPVCIGCYSANPTSRCPQCAWPACDPNCAGLQDPTHHGSECVLLRIHARRVQSIPDNFFKFEAILPLRCLLLQCRNPKKWKVVLGMEAHLKKRGPNTDIYKQVQENVVKYLTNNFFALLDQLEGGNKVIEDRSEATIHKVCGILDVNALEIRLLSDGSIFALYPTAYLMEHNCLPNTRHIFNSQTYKLTVLANQPINLGSHITTMYTHALWGTHQRQDHLRSTKYFTCRCKRCGDPTELGTCFSALRCLAPSADKKICGGSQLPVSPLEQTAGWRCEQCPTSLTTEQVVDLMNLISGEVESTQSRNPTVESLTTLLEKLRKLLHKNHYHCFPVMHSLIQLIGRQQGYLPHQLTDSQLENKIQLCNDLLSITSVLDPTSSRLMLYSAVVQVELYSATLAQIKRDTWPREESTEKLRECRTQLQSALKTLKPEESGSPGAKLRDLVTSSLDELAAFCSLNEISLGEAKIS